MNKQFLYQFDLKLEVGLVLEGNEVKLIRNNHPSITASYGFFANRELFIKNLTIYKNFERNIKCLLHKSELKKIYDLYTKKKYIIIPIKIYEKNGKFKMLIGVGVKQNERDRREEIKKRDAQREIRSEIY